LGDNGDVWIVDWWFATRAIDYVSWRMKEGLLWLDIVMSEDEKRFK